MQNMRHLRYGFIQVAAKNYDYAFVAIQFVYRESEWDKYFYCFIFINEKSKQQILYKIQSTEPLQYTNSKIFFDILDF